MNKVIMHKDDEVAVVKCKRDGTFKGLVEVKSEILLPDQTLSTELAIRRWFITRSQPKTVDETGDLRRFYGDSCFKSENLRSMLDCYWVKDEDSDEQWSEVNPFETWDCRSDSLLMMAYKPESFDGLDASSPNVTIPGTIPMMWYDFDGMGLINEKAQLEVDTYREAVAHGITIMEPREYKILAGRIFSFRRTAVSPDVERIRFDVIYNKHCDSSCSKSENLGAACNAIGISDWKDFFGQMIELDKITGNRKRELCDIGVLRNANTLEYIGFDKL